MTEFSYKIVYLADHPEYIETIAEWFWVQWLRDSEGWTLEQAVNSVRENDSFRNRLNVTLVALCENKPVGVIQLLDDERCPGYRNVGPWMGGLYVLPEHRNKGLGFQLSYALMQKALALDFDQIYCFTQDFDLSLKRHHFSKIDTIMYGSEPYRVYRKDLL